MLHSEKIENIYLWGTKIPILIIPFLPLYISSSMVFPYITGKNFAFRILVEFAAVFWVGLISLNKKYRPHNSAIFISILTFTFITGVADLMGVNPYNSFWSNYERMEGYITILHLALYFMIVRSVLQTRRDWLLFFNVILAVSLLVCLFSLNLPTATKGTRFWMEYVTRLYGTIGNPPFLASYLLLTIYIGFIVLLNTQKKYFKAFYIVLIFLSAVVIYLTATRGAILSGLIGLMIMSAFHIFKKIKLKKWKLINTVITAIVIVCFSVAAVTIITSRRDYSFEDSTTLFRFASMFSDDSVKARFNAWEMAWNGIKEKPVLGWGQENFIGIYSVNHIPIKGEQVWTDRAHNIVIEWLINAGILGLSAYIAMLGFAVYTIRKKYIEQLISQKETVVIVTVLSVYFIQNLFTFDTVNTYFILFALMAYIDIIGTPNNAEIKIVSKDGYNKKVRLRLLYSTFFALLAGYAVFYFANYKPIDESRKIIRISTSVSNYKSFPALLKDFTDTLAVNSFGDNEVKDRMRVVSEDFILSRELFDEEGALKFLETTVNELEKGILENYYNLEYITKVIELYKKISFYEPALVSKTELLIKWSINNNPEYEWLYYALAEIYELKKEYTKMFEVVNNMVALDPHNDQKQLKLALTAIFMEKEDITVRALEEIGKIRGKKNSGIANDVFMLEINELQLIAEAYLEVKNFQKAIHYFNLIISMKPDRARIHYDLANAYFNLGDRTHALRELKKAAEMAPSVYGEIAKKYGLTK